MRFLSKFSLRDRVIAFGARLILTLLKPRVRVKFFLYLIRKNKHSLIGSQQKKELFKKHKPSSVNLDKRIIGYMPKQGSGWILQYLFDDIASTSESNVFLRVDSLESAYIAASESPDSIFLAMHYYFVDDLIDIGIPPSQILAFYTHSRINAAIPMALYEVKGVLPMNSTEASLLLLAGINPRALRVFPAGYNPEKFLINPCFEEDHRDIDVMISCRFSDSVEPAYGTRKGYDSIVTLANALASDSKRVAIVGPGWSNATLLIDNRVYLIEPVHNDYPALYRRAKIFASLSRQEGGPVSWLEAMASGCITVSSATGFPLEIESGKLGSYLMPVSSLPAEWISKIDELLRSYKPLSVDTMLSRKEFLSPSSFQSLSIFLLETLNTDVLEYCHSWPTRLM